MPILKHIKKTRAFHFRWIPVKLNAGVSSQDERVFFRCERAVGFNA